MLCLSNNFRHIINRIKVRLDAYREESIYLYNMYILLYILMGILDRYVYCLSVSEMYVYCLSVSDSFWTGTMYVYCLLGSDKYKFCLSVSDRYVYCLSVSVSGQLCALSVIIDRCVYCLSL